MNLSCSENDLIQHQHDFLHSGHQFFRDGSGLVGREKGTCRSHKVFSAHRKVPCVASLRRLEITNRISASLGRRKFANQVESVSFEVEMLGFLQKTVPNARADAAKNRWHEVCNVIFRGWKPGACMGLWVLPMWYLRWMQLVPGGGPAHAQRRSQERSQTTMFSLSVATALIRRMERSCLQPAGPQRKAEHHQQKTQKEERS
jgi:hypothetical protein